MENKPTQSDVALAPTELVTSDLVSPEQKLREKKESQDQPHDPNDLTSLATSLTKEPSLQMLPQLESLVQLSLNCSPDPGNTEQQSKIPLPLPTMQEADPQKKKNQEDSIIGTTIDLLLLPSAQSPTKEDPDKKAEPTSTLKIKKKKRIYCSSSRRTTDDSFRNQLYPWTLHRIGFRQKEKIPRIRRKERKKAVLPQVDENENRYRTKKKNKIKKKTEN